MRLARVRPRRHACQAHTAHQALHALAIDDMTAVSQKHHHPPAAVKRTAGVLFVNQLPQLQLFRVFELAPAPSIHSPIDRGAWHACQFALHRQRHLIATLNPLRALGMSHSPSFFLSQSTCIFNRPISPYSLSSGLLSSTGLGPRLASNKAAALSRISLFHWPTSTGCTPNSCAISVTVLTPRTASRPTLPLNSAVCTRRFLPSLICCHPFTDHSLNHRLKFGIHYSSHLTVGGGSTFLWFAPNVGLFHPVPL